MKISSASDYQKQYNKSLEKRESFWAGIARNFVWFKEWNEVLKFDFKQPKVEWFNGGKLNITVNCLDRHLATKANDVAIIWEANNPGYENRIITYGELAAQVNQLANLLLAKNIKSGDRVCIYMPMIPEAAIAMLACARIGAVHCVVFAGFSETSLADRIKDSSSKMLITADYLYRGDKTIKLLDIAVHGSENCDSIENILVYRRGDQPPSFTDVNSPPLNRDGDQPPSFTDVNSPPLNRGSITPQSAADSSKNIIIWQDEIKKYSTQNKPAVMNSSDPLFILYTSGSTGKPKGIVHSNAGYMVYATYSFVNVFDYQDNDLFFCSADVGWITGHSYLVYAPLLAGAKILMFEGIPTYPTPSRFWEIIDKHKVNIFYTAPTAIRALMQKGDQFVDNFDLSSLKTLGTVGEPINEEAWHWYHQKVGKGKCPIVDTWWQTETGGILISSLAHKTQSNPSFAGLPLPGIEPILLDDNGVVISRADVVGNLCFEHPWPSMIKTIWNDHKKCFDTYFKRFPGYYFSGDGAFRDKEGNFRITGRVDDVINPSGHRLGTAEIENAINMHKKVSESAVIGYDHPIKGQGICAFVIVKNSDKSHEDDIKAEISSLVEKQISAIAKPDKIYITPDLPKTRSGKIMRRVLKKIIAKDQDLGDISTLVNPDIVAQLKLIVN